MVSNEAANSSAFSVSTCLKGGVWVRVGGLGGCDSWECGVWECVQVVDAACSRHLLRPLAVPLGSF